jgi:hypothetical protein
MENKTNLDGILKDKYAKGATEQMAKPNANAPLGQGGRFAALKKKLGKKGASDPGALAAWIGRKKYGKKGFAKLAAKGK